MGVPPRNRKSSKIVPPIEAEIEDECLCQTNLPESENMPEVVYAENNRYDPTERQVLPGLDIVQKKPKRQRVSNGPGCEKEQVSKRGQFQERTSPKRGQVIIRDRS